MGGSSGRHDEDHYQCDAGLCVYTGCKSTVECQEGLDNPDVVCQ